MKLVGNRFGVGDPGRRAHSAKPMVNIRNTHEWNLPQDVPLEYRDLREVERNTKTGGDTPDSQRWSETVDDSVGKRWYIEAAEALSHASAVERACTDGK